jgi:16S rRNA (adenine1518-N6/adenine1519-N6)-dimethyltransferase
MALLTPATVRSLLAEHGLRPSRALGQNFLADPNTARRIARLANVGPGDHVLEIGPGLGSLTLALVERGASVLAVERDRHLIPVIEDVVGGDRGTVQLAVADALEVDFATLFGEARFGKGTWTCVSNLPYNIATPVVVRVLEEAPQVNRMLVMVQREVGERLAAGPGGREYGAVSVRVAYYASAKIVGMVPSSVFVPAPRVESALVALVRRPAPPVDVPSTDRLFELVRAAFGQRRKMLRQSLKAVLGARTITVLEQAAVDPRDRAEALGLEAWAAIARAEETA